MGLFNRKKEVPPSAGRVENAATGFPIGNRNDNIPTTIPGYKSRNMDLLCSLRRERDVYRAIDLITDQHPDASMSATSYVRLANNGHQMEIYLPDGERNKEAESQWRNFASQAIDTNSKGFDGLIDQMHDSQYRFGGMGVELTVSRRARDVDGVHPILPQWITWEQDSTGRWRAYQQQGIKRVELTAGNFFWVAMDNKVGQPTGKLLMESSLISIDRQLQFFEDSAAVLRRAGYPRNDIAIDREAFIKSLSAAVRNDPKKLNEALSNYFDFIQGLMRRLDPKDDIIHFDDITVNKSSGENSRTIDQRAYLETIDPQVMNGLGIMGVMLNRTTGVTETWGTVQFRIMVQTVQNIQNGSKRLSERICDFWMRVNGIQGTCKFNHNPVDWEAELKRMEVSLKKQELHRRGEEYNWQDKAAAAKEGMNISALPTTPPEPRTAYISKYLTEKSGDGTKKPETEETT